MYLLGLGDHSRQEVVAGDFFLGSLTLLRFVTFIVHLKTSQDVVSSPERQKMHQINP